jgi:5-formyltetrahydrofolate cyclo-ligase
MPDFASEAEKSRSTKFALRSRIVTARQSLPEQVRRSAAASIHTHLRSLIHPAPPTPSPVTVAAYVPVGWEPGGPDLPEALAAALPPGGRLILPVLLDGGDLDWALYEGPLSLRAGPRGLREPAGRRLGVDAIGEADLVIVPALAVDRDGMRLGRGGGSYDRALARAGNAFTVALLHDGELVDSVPAEEHDQPVHAAITPSGGVTLIAGTDWTK